MLSNLTLKKSKQTEKLKVITFFSVAHFGLLLPKTRLILAPIWPFLKNFWFRFRFLKDNSMMMINSTDFASNLQKNRKMWTISYLLRWINNYRVLLLVYLGWSIILADTDFFQQSVSVSAADFRGRNNRPSAKHFFIKCLMNFSWIFDEFWNFMCALWHCRFDRTLSYSAKGSAHKTPKLQNSSKFCSDLVDILQNRYLLR